jgi:uncharacterized glyoxalase superfamily protein PhnB
MSAPATPPNTDINFHAATPILRVADLPASLEHYGRVLGFKVDWNAEGMASVTRGQCSLMLCAGHQGHPGTWVWIGVGDATALFEELSARGATIRLPPTNYPWALEFHVADPDGHVLRFGSEPREAEPYSKWVAWYERTT